MPSIKNLLCISFEDVYKILKMGFKEDGMVCGGGNNIYSMPFRYCASMLIILSFNLLNNPEN